MTKRWYYTTSFHYTTSFVHYTTTFHDCTTSSGLWSDPVGARRRQAGPRRAPIFAHCHSTLPRRAISSAPVSTQKWKRFHLWNLSFHTRDGPGFSEKPRPRFLSSRRTLLFCPQTKNGLGEVVVLSPRPVF